MRFKGNTTYNKVATSPQSKIKHRSEQKEIMAMFIRILGQQSNCNFACWIA